MPFACALFCAPVWKQARLPVDRPCGRLPARMQPLENPNGPPAGPFCGRLLTCVHPLEVPHFCGGWPFAFTRLKAAFVKSPQMLNT